MPITNLHFNDVGPFAEISFEFDERVNVFTGPNNSGKSTVLWVLGELLVYPFTMPAKVIRSESAAWKIDLLSANGVELFEGVLPTTPTEAPPDFRKRWLYVLYPRATARHELPLIRPYGRPRYQNKDRSGIREVHKRKTKYAPAEWVRGTAKEL